MADAIIIEHKQVSKFSLNLTFLRGERCLIAIVTYIKITLSIKNNYSLIFVFYSLFIIFASPYKVNKHFQITVIYQESKSICLESFSQKIPYDT